jgi:Zn-dependent peptidase ImmA (M78 family)
VSDIDYAPPKPSNLTKESVYQLAESIGQQLGYSPGGDLGFIIKSIGGNILYRDFWSDSDSGSLKVDAENNFQIYVANDTSLERDRFTIAHELGHYVLHYLWPNRTPGNGPLKLKANRYGSDRAEWEANWFAAAFLMPEEKFRIEFSKRPGDFFTIAKVFGVSALAAQTRAKALNLT